MNFFVSLGIAFLVGIFFSILRAVKIDQKLNPTLVFWGIFVIGNYAAFEVGVYLFDTDSVAIVKAGFLVIFTYFVFSSLCVISTLSQYKSNVYALFPCALILFGGFMTVPMIIPMGFGFWLQLAIVFFVMHHAEQAST
jgi:hypothetical protein